MSTNAKREISGFVATGQSMECFARRTARAIMKKLLKQGLMAPDVAKNDSKRTSALTTIEWSILDRLKGEVDG